MEKHKTSTESTPSTPAHNPKLARARLATLISYAITLLLTFNWLTWYSPPQDVPRSLLLLIMVVPLVLPIRGFLQGSAMATIGMALVAMWLFIAGLDIALYVQSWKALGWLLVCCSTGLFVTCYFYLRYLPRPPKPEK